MADILDQRDEMKEELRGVYRAKIGLSYIKPLEQDDRVIQWKLRIVIVDPESTFDGEGIWINCYFYPVKTDTQKGFTNADIDEMEPRQRARLRRAYQERTNWLMWLGVEDPSSINERDNAFFNEFKDTPLEVTVQTQGGGRRIITRAKLIGEDVATGGEISIDV